jgi:hypothetical protein
MHAAQRLEMGQDLGGRITSLPRRDAGLGQTTEWRGFVVADARYLEDMT